VHLSWSSWRHVAIFSTATIERRDGTAFEDAWGLNCLDLVASHNPEDS